MLIPGAGGEIRPRPFCLKNMINEDMCQKVIAAWEKFAARQLRASKGTSIGGRWVSSNTPSVTTLVGSGNSKGFSALERAATKLGYARQNYVDTDRLERNLQQALRRSSINVSITQALNFENSVWKISDLGGIPPGMGYGRYVHAKHSSGKEFIGIIQGSMRTGGLGAAQVLLPLIKFP